MNADSIYMIGARHSVCQDYVVAKDSYVILSDGCSTSPDTDVGSRLLVKAAERMLKTNDDPITLHKNAAGVALNWAESIGLPLQAVDATLLTAFVKDEDLTISCSGDGVVVIESTEGYLDVYVISYPAGYPFYPSYLHQPDRLRAVITNGRAYKEVKHFSSRSQGQSLQLENTTLDDSPTHVLRLKTVDVRYVALISDGVHSFFTNDHKQFESLDLSQVLTELLSFKSLNGAFVARRVKRFFKDCSPKGWQHADDLSIGALYLGGTECSPKPSRV